MLVPLQREALASALSLVLFAPAGVVAQNCGKRADSDFAFLLSSPARPGFFF